MAERTRTVNGQSLGCKGSPKCNTIIGSNQPVVSSSINADFPQINNKQNGNRMDTDQSEISIPPSLSKTFWDSERFAL